MRVERVLRYPVKSIVGEDLDVVEVDRRGVKGDRLWSVRDPDGKLGSGKSSKRFRKMDGLLALSARYDGDVPVIVLPDGRAARGDDDNIHDVLSSYVGRPVTLAHEDGVSHFDDGPLHLVTTSSLRALGAAYGSEVDVRHLRPNVLVATDDHGFVEDDWVGRRLSIGDALVIEVSAPMPRCVMTTMEQVDLAAENDLLNCIHDANHGNLGVLAHVVTPGPIVVGDVARLV